jgi:hypothetical protein
MHVDAIGEHRQSLRCSRICVCFASATLGQQKVPFSKRFVINQRPEPSK